MSQYQEISDRELYNAMKLHFDYLRSKGAEGERLDLRGYDLNRRHFQNYNFGGAILSGTNLEGCHFQNCTFTLADLSDVYADRASFDRCTFERTSLKHASMHATQHRRTIYKSIDFDYVKMDESLHDGTEFLFSNGESFDLSSSRIIGSRFQDGVFNNIDLHNTTMDGTYLDATSMYHANTKGMHLDSAILHDMTDFPVRSVLSHRSGEPPSMPPITIGQMKSLVASSSAIAWRHSHNSAIPSARARCSRTPSSSLKNRSNSSTRPVKRTTRTTPVAADSQ